jgi:hypothetical protein
MTEMRILAVGIAIAILVLVLTGGRLFFLPLLFVPFGLFSAGHRKRRRTTPLDLGRRSRWL